MLNPSEYCQPCQEYHELAHINLTPIQIAHKVVMLRRNGLSFARIGVKIKKSKQRAYQIWVAWKDYDSEGQSVEGSKS